MTVGRVAERLRSEARRVDERRLLVLTGDAERAREGAADALDAADVAPTDASYVGTAEDLPWETIAPRRAAELLGRTRDAIVLDCHDECRPNAIGRAVGAVDGGGLLVLLAPPLDDWSDRRDGFDESLAVPPFEVADVRGNFRSRLVSLLHSHPGVAIVDVDADAILRDGLTDPPPRRPPSATDSPAAPDDASFPAAVYERCLTADQIEAVRALEGLRVSDHAVVVEADRGRGKSSAAGLAAAALALDGRDVLVTAPEYRNAAEAFARVEEALRALDALAESEGDGDPDEVDPTPGDGPRRRRTEAGGSIRFERPVAAADLPGDPDAVVVDEAAALPVRILERFLDGPAVAFATTVHGYEGAGRGFSVRFRDRLAESDRDVTDVEMADPIRYADGDPVESWAFRALGLDAAPAVDQVVADATPDSVAFRTIEPADLLADDNLLREVFGLLVHAHYRTEPNDLARLLDAPNVSVRALTYEGHVVSVALLAREGDLPASLRAHMYRGGRVRGNMIPDVLTSQLRDEDAAVPVGQRVMRIATHHAVRSRGLGSRLLDEIRAECSDDVDWLGTSYGATPDLVRFWRSNGFRTVHLSTTRNDASGEYSAVMLDPTSDAGRGLARRHARWFVDRVAAVLSDPLDDVDPDVARAVLRSVDATPALDLSAWEWRLLAGLPNGAGTVDTSPRPLRRLAVGYLVEADSVADGDRVTDDVDSTVDRDRTVDVDSTVNRDRDRGDSDSPEDRDRSDGDDVGSAAGADGPRGRLSAREERLLVGKVLQGRPWSEVADELDYHSHAECMRALGGAVPPLLSRFGDTYVQAELERFE